MSTPPGPPGFVRAFDGLVVRQEQAAWSVVPMPQSGDETRVPLDPTRYDAPRPSLYRYRQDGPEGRHTGLVCAVDVAALVDGHVRGHEAVQPLRVDALVTHLAASDPPVELITTLLRPGPALAASLTADDGSRPLVDVTTDDGVRHTVWPVPADRDLLDEMSANGHYVADGHHRVSASRILWERAGRPPDATVGAVCYPLDGLDLAAFARLLPGPVDAKALLRRLTASYDVAETGAGDLGPSDVRVRTGGRWHTARWRGTPPRGVAGLGATLLDHALAGLAVSPTRLDATTLERAADATAGAGFALTAPPLTSILDLADAGELLPPKTTYFSPKPASGLFLHRSGGGAPAPSGRAPGPLADQP